MARAKFDVRKETSPFTSPRATNFEILKVLQGFQSILDIGCGRCSPIRFADAAKLVGVDAFEPDLERARQANTHDEFLLADCRSLADHFDENQFELCIAKDVIEHVSREDGMQLIRDMERIASKRIVLFTPNGFLTQHSAEEGDLQQHLSGWTVADMRELGFTVVGLLGPSVLRTEGHAIKYKPAVLWGLISMVLQALWCRHRPNTASAILCWKDLPN